MIYFVSRHESAIQWAKLQDLAVDKWLPHLDPEQITEGDIIIGSLPIHMVAALGKQGARYIHLSLEIPQALRGKELSVEEMAQCGATLEEYSANLIGTVGYDDLKAKAKGKEG